MISLGCCGVFQAFELHTPCIDSHDEKYKLYDFIFMFNVLTNSVCLSCLFRVSI